MNGANIALNCQNFRLPGSEVCKFSKAWFLKQKEKFKGSMVLSTIIYSKSNSSLVYYLVAGPSVWT